MDGRVVDSLVFHDWKGTRVLPPCMSPGYRRWFERESDPFGVVVLERGDERLYWVVAVTPGNPEEAAKEIRRIGGHESKSAVAIAGNVMGQPLGDPIYDPIYKAAIEMGLPLTLHIGSGETLGPRPLGATSGTGLSTLPSLVSRPRATSPVI